MQPSAWGHPSVLICHNPPCIYARTLRASGRHPMRCPLTEATRAPQVKVGDGVLTADVLSLAGGSKARKLVALLADGQRHSADECLAKSGMNVPVLRSTVRRVRHRGFEIVTSHRTRFSPLTYELVAVPAMSTPERKSA